MDDGYPYDRDRYGREDRDRTVRASGEVRSWFGDDAAAQRRRMDEQERSRSGSHWGHERSYSSDREYGDGGYGWRSPREAQADARQWSSTEGWRVPGPHAGRGPRGYQRSDERIREELNDRLTMHGYIDATDIECRVVDGEVTLTGFVDSRAAKRAAEDIADALYGVREVHNQLRVRTHAPAEGVGRTSVLGLTEAQTESAHPATASTVDPGRPRTRA